MNNEEELRFCKRFQEKQGSQQTSALLAKDEAEGEAWRELRLYRNL